VGGQQAFVHALVALLLLTATASAQTTHRAWEEMRGGCADYALDVKDELRAMRLPPQRILSLPAQKNMEPLLPSRSPLSIGLHFVSQVTSVTKLETPGLYSGILMMKVPKDGVYRISSSVPLSLYVIGSQGLVEPIDFELQTGCSVLFKVARYRLVASVPYWLQLSSNANSVTLLFTGEDAH
jgi:hypothetical protein